RLDEALDEAGVTAEQRPQIDAARDQLFATLGALHAEETLPAALERALKLFEADRVDTAAVAALRAEHVERMHKVADAVEQALFDHHDALTPAQRQALVANARAMHERFGAGHHGGPEAAPPVIEEN